MDAAYFRSRALRARAMANEGDDPRLSRMLLDVAQEFEEEADLIEAVANRQARPADAGGRSVPGGEAKEEPAAQAGEASRPAWNKADSKASSPLSFVEIGSRSNASSAS